MVLVKKCQIFLYLDLIEIRVEIMLNNFVEKKKLFWTTKKTFSKSPKSQFSKEVNPCSWSKNAILFSFLFSVNMRLEIRFHDVLDEKINSF